MEKNFLEKAAVFPISVLLEILPHGSQIWKISYMLLNNFVIFNSDSTRRERKSYRMQLLKFSTSTYEYGR